MKTNFKTSKENRKERATLKSVIIAAILVITVSVANAQGIWDTYFNNDQETAFLWAGTNVENFNEVNSNAAALATFADFLVEENEETLEIEGWMTETENFGTFINIEEETENSLELEEWMLNEKTFEVENEKEQPLKLESWMTAEHVWK